MDCFERLEIKKEIVRKKKVLTWKLSMFPLSNWSLVIFLVNDLLLLLMLLSSFWLCSLFVLSLARVNLDTISFFSISSEVHFHFRSMGRIRQRKLPPLGGVSLYRRPPVYFASIQLLCSCWLNLSITCLVETKSVKQEVRHTMMMAD